MARWALPLVLTAFLRSIAAADYVYLLDGRSIYGVVVVESDTAVTVALAEGGWRVIPKSEIRGIERHCAERRAEILASRPTDVPAAASLRREAEEQPAEEQPTQQPEAAAAAAEAAATTLPVAVGDPADEAAAVLGPGHRIEMTLKGRDDAYEIRVEPGGAWVVYRYPAGRGTRVRARPMTLGDGGFVWYHRSAKSVRMYEGDGGLAAALSVPYDRERVRRVPELYMTPTTCRRARLATTSWRLVYPDLGVTLRLDRDGRRVEAIELRPPCRWRVEGVGIGDDLGRLTERFGEPEARRASGRGQVWSYRRLGEVRVVSGHVDEMTITRRFRPDAAAPED